MMTVGPLVNKTVTRLLLVTLLNATVRLPLAPVKYTLRSAAMSLLVETLRFESIRLWRISDRTVPNVSMKQLVLVIAGISLFKVDSARVKVELFNVSRYDDRLTSYSLSLIMGRMIGAMV